MQGSVIDFHGAQPIVSREAVAMFRWNNNIYKILNDTHNSQVLERNLTDADTNFGLPTPYEKIFHATYQADDKPPNTAVIVFKMKILDMAHFFQFSHAGEARLRGWINNEHSRERLKRIKRAFLAAKGVGLMDPQGVFSMNAFDPITFIDVHTRHLASHDFDDLMEFIDQKLSEGIYCNVGRGSA
jgi:hypothetical protein